MMLVIVLYVIWVNYNNMARLRGIIPKLAELFRFVNYYNLPKCYSYVLVMLYLIIDSY